MPTADASGAPHAPPLRDKLAAALGPTFELGRELGGGGMSRVFLARDLSLGREIVVKLLLPELAAGVSVTRFRREIALAARLQHPNIVTVLSAGDVEGLPYFTMPYVRGESLRALLERNELIEIPRAIRILRDVACALARAHEEGVVHRDIKPANILLTGGAAVVTDFGVAKALSSSREIEEEEDRETTLTITGTSLGTPDYMSPEQATADPTMDHRADIYSYGVTAYHLLAGRLPFEARTQRETVTAHLTKTPPTVDTHRADVPPALAALVARCMEKDPAARPQSAEEVVDELDRIANSGASGERAAVRQPRPAWLGWAVAALLAATAIGLALMNSRSAPAADPRAERAATGATAGVPAAQAAYARGLDFYRRARQDTANASYLAPAMEAFEEAVRLDPAYAQAYAKLAEARFWWASLDTSDPRRMQLFEQALNKAVELNPTLPEVRAAQALRMQH